MELKTIDDLDALRTAAVKEGEKWEIKSVWPVNQNVEKTICAFANTSGGIVLIGVDYDNTINQIIGYPGVDKVRGLEEKAIDIGGNINPRVIPTSSLIDVSAGKVVQVIEVFKSRIIPHMASNYIYYQRVDKENAPIPESIIEKLYLARHVQEREANAFLKEKEYFMLPGDPHWLNICFCPLYLEPELICHSRPNLEFLNSLINIIDPPIVNIFFRSIPEGYRFEIPHPKTTGKAIFNYLIEVFGNGVLASGMWIKYDEPYWEEVHAWFSKMILFYTRLQTKFRYPGWTKVTLGLTKMWNVKMVFPDHRTDSRMYALSRPMIAGDLLISLDFEDNVLSDNPAKVVESFYTKVKVNYGLDEYIP
jgi:hypothetical protein